MDYTQAGLFDTESQGQNREKGVLTIDHGSCGWFARKWGDDRGICLCLSAAQRIQLLRAQITRFFLRGGDVFSLEKLDALCRARTEADAPVIAPFPGKPTA